MHKYAWYLHLHRRLMFLAQWGSVRDSVCSIDIGPQRCTPRFLWIQMTNGDIKIIWWQPTLALFLAAYPLGTMSLASSISSLPSLISSWNSSNPLPEVEELQIVDAIGLVATSSSIISTAGPASSSIISTARPASLVTSDSSKLGNNSLYLPWVVFSFTTYGLS